MHFSFEPFLSVKYSFESVLLNLFGKCKKYLCQKSCQLITSCALSLCCTHISYSQLSPRTSATVFSLLWRRGEGIWSPNQGYILGGQFCVFIDAVKWISIATLAQEVCCWHYHQVRMQKKSVYISLNSLNSINYLYWAFGMGSWKFCCSQWYMSKCRSCLC